MKISEQRGTYGTATDIAVLKSNVYIIGRYNYDGKVTSALFRGGIALLLQTFISFIVYPIGALFLYYSVVLFLVTWLKENFGRKGLSIIIWILALIPIV